MKGEYSMRCWFCGSLLIWDNDFSYEDYNTEGEGVVTVLHCSVCNSTWEGYLDLNEDEEE